MPSRAALLLLACTLTGHLLRAAEPAAEAKEYWFGGKAEVTSYRLEQVRYGEVRDGRAVLVFVSEPFSISKHVKLDAPEKAGSDGIEVLKMNAVRNFTTGIYAYSVMTSTFTPFAQPAPSLKVDCSTQEWCGNTFTQLDRRGPSYFLQTHSYFETEGERTGTLAAAWLEDELLNLIRLDPDRLPRGEVNVIPAILFSRFVHQPVAVQRARAETDDDVTFADLPCRRFRLTYLTGKHRVFSVYYEREFPRKILGWEETYDGDPGGRPGEGLVTRAVQLKTVNTAYWNQHALADEGLRRDLGL